MERKLMERAKILVVDDEESMRDFMSIMLSKEGYEVLQADSGPAALGQIKKSRPDVIITDIMMPEMSGLELMTKAQEMHEDLSFIVMTAFASVDSAIEAMKKGAYDYITKPFKVDEIKLTIKKVLEKEQIARENKELKKELSRNHSLDSFIGNDPKIIKMKEMIQRLAKTDSNALILGESGTGKDLVANAIHYHSNRVGKPFLTLNCAAIPETLLESELFGYKKGAFTGALKDKEGVFKAAHTGTLFLDEIGNTSPAIQMKLLRVLDDQVIMPVGSTQTIKVDVRLVAATNANLEEEVMAKHFREDLFYRLNVFTVQIPPLRERRDDIVLLVDHFVKMYCRKMGIKAKEVNPDALDILLGYEWPGNVRELENTIERSLVVSTSDKITADDLPDKVSGRVLTGHSAVPEVQESVQTGDQGESPTLESIEKAYIFWVLNQTGWNKTRAAKILGIDASTLYRKIDRYDLKQ
ncbi:MAG TPA: sigma-54-dependent Fis family transcriptional regulator [candidate division Zixibacteria bacterium]|nr:sigma-54-dependent Fis family transcriptional regulator [candidate division Zixibacteria bacterium]